MRWSRTLAISHSGDGRVRLISPGGVVRTLAGTTHSSPFWVFRDVAACPDGSIIVASSCFGVSRISMDGVCTHINPGNNLHTYFAFYLDMLSVDAWGNVLLTRGGYVFQMIELPTGRAVDIVRPKQHLHTSIKTCAIDTVGRIVYFGTKDPVRFSGGPGLGPGSALSTPWWTPADHAGTKPWTQDAVTTLLLIWVRATAQKKTTRSLWRLVLSFLRHGEIGRWSFCV